MNKKLDVDTFKLDTYIPYYAYKESHFWNMWKMFRYWVFSGYTENKEILRL